MRKTMLGLVLALLALPATVASAQQAQPSHIKASWYSCRLTVRGEQIESRTCRTYAMPRAPHAPLGWWIRRSRVDALHLRSVRYPTFRAAKPEKIIPKTIPLAPASTLSAPVSGTAGLYFVTGYSYGCGDVNGVTASGLVPQVGYVATGGSNDYIGFGTRVYVPSLGYAGVVEDRGQGMGGFDLFVATCSDALLVTGWRQVIIG